MYTEEDIVKAIAQADREVTDDCMAAGVYTLGAIILGVSEDTIMAMLEAKDGVEYLRNRR